MEEKIWKKSTERGILGVERATLTHRQDHLREVIVTALESKPIWTKPIDFGMSESPGTVSTHPYGNGQIVVRFFEDGNWARKIFRNVESVRKRKACFDEEHIAFVQRVGSSKAALVTLALMDENNRMLPTLETYFKDGKKTSPSLQTVAMNAIKKLAEFHAGGFSHGHPSCENVLVENPGTIRLIDPKDITPIYRLKAKSAEEYREKDRDTLAEQILMLMENKLSDREHDELSKKLDEEYARHYKRCKEKDRERT